ncbi:DUF3606 domain-containing protein [Brevundimonas sp.]|uniref:DUF3606 domain-containing protein n=1 Tax=Brevundimonas sp. TaxID=1871086 RepID=UPI002D4E90B1|nr:DUF3606 domain-containing protein [Brevundimonas sp.]HYC67079.1 DUF3606 domain-containing protein [Brevundimonas sp.]
MGATFETQAPQDMDWSPALGSTPDAVAMRESDIQQLAQTFAVTPEAVRLAVARVGPGFREVQRELGGRR